MQRSGWSIQDWGWLVFGEAPLAATLTGGIIVFTAVLVHMLVSLRGGRALVVKES